MHEISAQFAGIKSKKIVKFVRFKENMAVTLFGRPYRPLVLVAVNHRLSTGSGQGHTCNSAHSIRGQPW